MDLRKRGPVAVASGSPRGDLVEDGSGGATSSGSPVLRVLERTRKQLERHKQTYYGDFVSAKLPYNAALGAVAGPALAVLLAVGGRAMLGAVCATLLMGYLLELLHVREGALVAMWFSLIWVSLSFSSAGLALVRHAGANLFLLLHGALLIVSVALWISIQYAWFHALLPGFTIVFERLLFSATGVSAAAVLSWAAVVAFGADSAPYAVLAVLHCVYSVLFVPRFSAFRVRRPDVPDSEYFITSYPETVLLLLCYVALPGAVHVAMYHAALAAHDAQAWASLGALATLPLLGLRVMSARRPLWLLERAPAALRIAQAATLWLPAAVLPLAACVRVIMPSYMADIALPAPWGHALIIGAAYAAVAAAGAARIELVHSHHAPLVHGAAAATALAAAAVLGAPLWLWPVAEAGAHALLWFLFNHAQPRRHPWAAYALAVACATACMAWFFSAKLAFVSFHFAHADVALSHVLGLLAAVSVGAWLLLGLLLSRAAPELLDAALLVYAAAFAFAEWLLAYGHGGADVLYGEWLVAATSLGGVYVTRLAQRTGRVTRGGAWAATCVWLAKAAALLCPAGDTPAAALAALLVLWSAAPLLYHWATPRTLGPGAATGYAAALALALAVCALSPLPACAGAWLAVPVDTMSACGAAALLWGIHSLALAKRFFPHSTARTSAAMAALITGAVLLLVQPAVASEQAASPADVVAAWALFALLLYAVAPFALAPVRAQLRARDPLRIVYSALTGVAASVYFNAAFVVPHNLYAVHSPVTVLFAAASTGAFGVTARLTMGLLMAGVPEAPHALATRFAVSFALFPLCFGLAGAALSGPASHAALDAVRVALLATHCALLFALALGLAVLRARAQHAAGRLAAATTLSRHERDAKRVAPVAAPAAAAPVAAAEAAQRQLVGNAAAVLCLLCCFALGTLYLHASALTLSPLCAVLLLCAGPALTPYRYTVALGAAVAAVWAAALWRVAVAPAGLGAVGLVKNVVLLCASLPSLWLVTKTLTTDKRRDVFALLLSAPAPLLMGLLADAGAGSAALGAYAVLGTLVATLVITRTPAKMKI